MKDAKEGIIVAGGNDEGNSLKQLSSPQGVIVDQSGQIYVTDNDNHRVMRWCEGVSEGMIIIGGNGRGQQSNQLNRPSGLSFDRLGNLYIADCNNNRIQKFDIEQNEVN
jgi:DNA-binding beta-propeller fold protein YncE